MLRPVRFITVYAASSSRIDPLYFEAARELGTLMALSGITCINGAGGKGLMAAVTDAVLDSGGDVCGIIPRFMVDEGWMHSKLKDPVVTDSMHARKQLMADRSDGCIALPGGIGTMEELLEIITWKQLGLYTKPVVILNTNGFYDDLLAMLQKALDERFMHGKHASIWHVASTPEEALQIVTSCCEWEDNPRSFAAL